MSAEDCRTVIMPVMWAPEEATFDVEEPPNKESKECCEEAEDGEHCRGKR